MRPTWEFCVLKNTIVISDECAKDLFESQYNKEYHYWKNLDDVRDGENLLEINDWEYNYDCIKDVLNTLLKHKVFGDICFGIFYEVYGSELSGYRFFNDGTYKELEIYRVFKWKEKGQ